MSYVLKVECIGDDTDQHLKLYRNITNDLIPGLGDLTFGKSMKRYWIAEITGLCEKFKYQRNFLRYKKDYSEANSIGSRGVYAYYILQEGHIYEVCAPLSWKSTDRYFCTVKDGELIRLPKEMVDQWLANNT